jgi:hypothetical protein
MIFRTGAGDSLNQRRSRLDTTATQIVKDLENAPYSQQLGQLSGALKLIAELHGTVRLVSWMDGSKVLQTKENKTVQLVDRSKGSDAYQQWAIRTGDGNDD